MLSLKKYKKRFVVLVLYFKFLNLNRKASKEYPVKVPQRPRPSLPVYPSGSVDYETSPGVELIALNLSLPSRRTAEVCVPSKFRGQAAEPYKLSVVEPPT